VTTPESSASDRPSTPVLIASTLAWIQGLLQGGHAFGGVYLSWTTRLGQVLVGVLWCIVGYLLRQRRKTGGRLAFLALGTSILVTIFADTFVGPVIGFAPLIIILVLVTWKQLR
jgi:hypothetical protein